MKGTFSKDRRESLRGGIIFGGVAGIRAVSIALLATLSLIGVTAATRVRIRGHGPVPVLVAKVIRKTVAQRLHAIGRVEAYSTVEIKSQINGQVMQVHFKEGQEVRRGDLLFTIDPRPFEAALNSAIAISIATTRRKFSSQ